MDNKKKTITVNINSFKLLPSAKPPLFHGQTVRKAVTDHLWRKKIRPLVLEQQGGKCMICRWMPETKAETKHLHLHEIEEYDFINKVCHLINIQLICRKCHAFQHIIRTEMVSTKEQWASLLNHFMLVNGCSIELMKHFDLIAAKALQEEEKKWVIPAVLSAERLRYLKEKPVCFTINPELPFADEMRKQLEKKGLLYNSEW